MLLYFTLFLTLVTPACNPLSYLHPKIDVTDPILNLSAKLGMIKRMAILLDSYKEANRTIL